MYKGLIDKTVDNTSKFEKLDKLLWLEELKTGKRVYKRGNELKHGLLDVNGIC